MFKSLRNKIQSLSETQQNILTVILVLFNLGIIIFWISFFVTSPKPTPAKIEEESIPFAEEALQPGEIGELKEVEKPENELPTFIFNTSGVIKEINKDKIIVLGNGSDFSDKKPRELTLIFDESTITFESGQKIRYQGLEGLKHLEIGESISVSSSENIRGKTEFIVNTINK